MRLLKLPALVAMGAVALAAAGLIACGDDEERVEVTLAEFVVEPADSTLESGEVTFVGTNIGNEVHELVICSDSCAAGESAELEEAEDIAPGEEGEFSIDLEPGTYELACLIEETEEDGTIESHYDEGMHATITVE